MFLPLTVSMPALQKVHPSVYVTCMSESPNVPVGTAHGLVAAERSNQLVEMDFLALRLKLSTLSHMLA